MPDFLVRHIDSLLAERILALAKARQGSVNDVMLAALRRGLGMSLPGEDVARGTLATEDTQTHHLDATEIAAFEEAIEALALAQPAPLALVPAADC